MVLTYFKYMQWYPFIYNKEHLIYDLLTFCIYLFISRLLNPAQVTCWSFHFLYFVPCINILTYSLTPENIKATADKKLAQDITSTFSNSIYINSRMYWLIFLTTGIYDLVQWKFIRKIVCKKQHSRKLISRPYMLTLVMRAIFIITIALNAILYQNHKDPDHSDP